MFVLFVPRSHFVPTLKKMREKFGTRMFTVALTKSFPPELEHESYLTIDLAEAKKISQLFDPELGFEEFDQSLI